MIHEGDSMEFQGSGARFRHPDWPRPSSCLQLVLPRSGCPYSRDRNVRIPDG